MQNAAAGQHGVLDHEQADRARIAPATRQSALTNCYTPLTDRQKSIRADQTMPTLPMHRRAANLAGFGSATWFEPRIRPQHHLLEKDRMIIRTQARRRMTIPLMALTIMTASADVTMAQAQITPEMRARLRTFVQACGADNKRFCQGVQRGDGRVVACLQSHASELTSQCSAVLASTPKKPG
jgi:hypothetical protein